MNSKKRKNTINFLLNYSLPEDQKPIQEYIEAKKNIFFKIVFYSSKKYFFCFVIFFSFFFFSNLYFFSLLKKTILIDSILSSFSFFLCFLFINFLFLRWWEINSHFEKSYIFYEESSWFTSQLWEKPFFLLKLDNLVSFKKSRLLLRRIFLNFLYLSIYFLVTFITHLIIRGHF